MPFTKRTAKLYGRKGARHTNTRHNYAVRGGKNKINANFPGTKSGKRGATRFLASMRRMYPGERFRLARRRV